MLKHIPFPALPAPPSWFPGHMNQFQRRLPALLKQTDVVLELRDARLPLTSINTAFEGWFDLILTPLLSEWPRRSGQHSDRALFRPRREGALLSLLMCRQEIRQFILVLHGPRRAPSLAPEHLTSPVNPIGWSLQTPVAIQLYPFAPMAC